MKSSILVIFGKELPKKNKSWFGQFDKILGPEELEKFISSGSVQEAYRLVNNLSRMVLSDGSRLSKKVNYHGYELWWMNYDTIYDQFCFPYTQYADLLSYLKDFHKIYLFQPPLPQLFQYFLQAHNRQCFILNPFKLRRLLPIPFGILMQAVLSIVFLPWSKLVRPSIMLYINDQFDPPHDFDFRKKLIYEELHLRRVRFIEFIRSLERWPVVLQHAWQRRRPVFYSSAVSLLIHFLFSLFSQDDKKHWQRLAFSSNPEEYFWLLAGAHYIRNVKGIIWSIGLMKSILRWLGVRSAIIGSGGGRTFHEILGCKLAGIPTVGIQHGATSAYLCPSDFMPEFDGEKSLSVDKYGLWSEWWRSYYIENSKVLKPEQLYVSGHKRPLEKEMDYAPPQKSGKGRLRVLFVGEQLSQPKEILPYLSKLLEAGDFIIGLKFRPQLDGFEEWLKKNQSDIFKRVDAMKGNIHDAISRYDVVVGSNSTAVLEASLQLKPFVFFRTQRFGDYFGMKSLDSNGYFFADNPEELVACIRKSPNVPPEELKQLRERFFGDPYRNGSKWVVETAERLTHRGTQRLSL